MAGLTVHVFWKERFDSAADSTLRRALATLRCEVRELPAQQWDASTGSIGGVRDYKCSYVSPASPEWSSIVLHHNPFIGERLAAELSTLTSAPSIAFSEFGQVTWGYMLFSDGAASDKFWSDPDTVEEDAAAVRGTPALLSGAFGVPESLIAPYLQHISSDFTGDLKVFPDDECELSNHWVRVDFMRRLGLAYPDLKGTAGAHYIQIVEPPAPLAR
jgi:hypothetical protein